MIRHAHPKRARTVAYQPGQLLRNGLLFRSGSVDGLVAGHGGDACRNMDVTSYVVAALQERVDYDRLAPMGGEAV